jgi:hypothetical protein
MPEPTSPHWPLRVVFGVVGNAAIEIVEHPDLLGRKDEVKEQITRAFVKPRVAALDLGDEPDDDPSDGERDDCDGDGDGYDRLR